MNDNLTNSVKKALKLIQAGKPDAARPILLEVLKQDENLEQAWFLLSFTLPSGERQEYALDQALRVNPNFARARERLEKLQNPESAEVAEEGEGKAAEAQQPVEASAEQPEASAEQPAENSQIQEKEARASEFPTDTFIEGVDMEVEKEKKPFPKRRLAIVGLIIVLLVVVLFVASSGVLGNLFGAGQPAATSTAVQGFRTLPPTWTP